jgi:CRP/FNR family transcriptional regulator, cyclic AMP receptor protein
MPSGFRFVSRRPGGILRDGEVMRASYGLEIIENCLSCPHRQGRLYCNLSPPVVESLAAITSAAVYPKGVTLFVEGQSPRGVIVLCSGRVKLSTSSADGRTLILRISESGDCSVCLQQALESLMNTAEVIEPTQVNFMAREDFLRFLRDHGETALRVALQLGETYHSAVAEMRTIALSHSASVKLARFLLDLCSNHTGVEADIRADFDADTRGNRPDYWCIA